MSVCRLHVGVLQRTVTKRSIWMAFMMRDAYASALLGILESKEEHGRLEIVELR